MSQSISMKRVYPVGAAEYELITWSYLFSEADPDTEKLRDLTANNTISVYYIFVATTRNWMKSERK
jgi:hypothetical protein